MEEHQDTFSYLDSYCERAGDAGMWGEPLNAVSNLFFFAAAIAAAYVLGKRADRGKVLDIWLMITALSAIAVGSGLWHLMPTEHTVLMDVIPIGLFINIYLLSAMRRFLGFGWGKVILLWLAYFATDRLVGAYVPPDTFNGTIMYVPTYIALAALTAGIWRKNIEQGRVFLRVLSLWTVSLFLRTLDMGICPSIPIGTHFLWHTLNAWVLYRLLVVLIQHPKKS